MNMETPSEFSKDFETALEGYYTGPAPSKEFTARLEQQLRSRQLELLAGDGDSGVVAPSRWHRLRRYLNTYRWQMAALTFLLAAILALGIIGPQRVLAEVQRLFSYVPGVGFVDLDQTRVLAAPVEITRDGITLRVEQVVAEKDRTRVVFSSQGLPAEEQLWPEGGVHGGSLKAYLRLPDGSALETTAWSASLGAGRLEFPGLPEGVYRVRLELDMLPMTPEGRFPEDWQVPLNLRMANGELAAELFPQPYSPQDAVDTQHGITLRVLSVAQSPDETAVQWQVELPETGWRFQTGLGGYSSPVLRDDLGHVYQVKRDQNGSEVAQEIAVLEAEPGQAAPTAPAMGQAVSGTEIFAPLSIGAHQAILQVSDMMVQIPVDAHFTFDPGEDPQLGNVWPLDIQFNIDDFPVKIISARWAESQHGIGDGPGSVLSFRFAPLPEQDGKRLDSLSIGVWPEDFNGGGSRSGDEGFELQFYLPQGASLPARALDFQIDQASVIIHGPWQAGWQIPGSQQVEQAPVRLHPTDATQQVSGVALKVDEVVLSDRLTAVHLTSPELPEGSQIVQILPYDPATFDFENYDPETVRRAISLRDDRGREYLPYQNDVVWQDEGEPYRYDPSWIIFGALQPFAHQLRLQFPAVGLFLPGEVRFEVQVPDGLNFNQEQTSIQHYTCSSCPPVEETVTYQASDPWEVDIPLEIAGYRLHFSQARVEIGSPGYEGAYRLVLSGEPQVSQQGALQITSLRFAAIRRPDGQVQVIENDPNLPYRSDRPRSRVDGQEATLELDVTTPDGLHLMPGRYKVSLDGVSVTVPGPWQFSWAVMGQ